MTRSTPKKDRRPKKSSVRTDKPKNDEEWDEIARQIMQLMKVIYSNVPDLETLANRAPRHDAPNDI